MGLIAPHHDSLGDKESACSAGDPGSIPGSGRSAGEGMGYPLQYSWASHSSILGFPWYLSWWRVRLQCWRPGFDPWVGKILWRRERLPTAVFWPGEFHGLYSPWGHKESDTTEWLSLHFMTLQPWYHSHGSVRLQSRRGSVGVTKVTHHPSFVFQFDHARP